MYLVNEQVQEEQPSLTYCESIFELSHFSLQIAAKLACYILYLTITLHYLSHSVTTTEVAGFGICLTILLLILFPLGLGLTFTENIQVSQAIGHGNQQLAQQYLLITIYVFIAFYILISTPIFVLKDQFQILLNDDAQATINAAWSFLPYLWFVNMASCIVEYIQVYLLGNKICYHLKYIYGTTTVTHLFLCQYFIQNKNMGLVGAGIALTITECLNLILTLAFILFTNEIRSKFQQLGLRIQWELVIPYLKTSASFIFIAYIDYSFQSFMYLVAARYDQHTFNAQVALINFRGLIGRLSQGLQLSLQTVVASEMGALRVNYAQKYAKSGLIVCSIFALMYIPLSLYFKFYIINFYSGDEQVQDIMDEILIFLLINIFAHSVVYALAGVLRGIDHQEFNSKVNFLINYFVAIPVILYLAFYRGHSLQGIWIGYTAALSIQALTFAFKIVTDQWDFQSLQIYKKLQRQSTFKDQD